MLFAAKISGKASGANMPRRDRVARGARMGREATAGEKSRPTISTSGPEASAGPNGIAIAPPAYDLDVVDRPAAKPEIETTLARDTMPPLAAENQMTEVSPAALAAPMPATFEVSEPDDPFEREAEAVAEAVMRTPVSPPALPEGGGEPPLTPPPPDSQNGTLQRQSSQPGQGRIAPIPSASTVATIRHPGPGSPIPTPVRQRIEPHLGADLRGVRVHAGPQAQRAASDLQAQAFTTGNNIFLSPSASQRNVRLMAHEATHVVQQGGAWPGANRSPSPSPPLRSTCSGYLTLSPIELPVMLAIFRDTPFSPSSSVSNPLTGERVFTDSRQSG